MAVHPGGPVGTAANDDGGLVFDPAFQQINVVKLGCCWFFLLQVIVDWVHVLHNGAAPLPAGEKYTFGCQKQQEHTVTWL